jgi:hypothetical protein
MPFAIFANVLELEDDGEPVNAKHDDNMPHNALRSSRRLRSGWLPQLDFARPVLRRPLGSMVLCLDFGSVRRSASRMSRRHAR